ncbi:MAG: DUF3179 domain-containing protein [Alphaproteobacteria bacterium]|nr:DUF3179 domain-containing protein [Alphaproteobacteria bacterium]
MTVWLHARLVDPIVPLLCLILYCGTATAARASGDVPAQWLGAWPHTDFSRRLTPQMDMVSGGRPRDAIPPIDAPTFVAAGDAGSFLRAKDSVVSVAIGGERRAYPLSVLLWHQVVNDTVAGAAIAVTYCPLTDAAQVFERRVNGRDVSFGTSGMLGRSNTILWDRAGESWWQQYTGEAIVGAAVGQRLVAVAARVEAFGQFLVQAPAGQVLAPPNPSLGQYGVNPFTGYDQAQWPFLYRGTFPKGLAPMMRVVAVDGEAWSWSLLRARGRTEAGDLVIKWEAGRASALDKAAVSEGRDIGSIVVQRRGLQGWEDARHMVSFAFAFHAFHPTAPIHVNCAAGASGWDVEPPLACTPGPSGTR